MGVAVGINCQRADRGNTLTHDAFKRGAHLAAQQRQGLIVRDPPLIESGPFWVLNGPV
jgi:hypothetical protein